jgi:hypothetical protein
MHLKPAFCQARLKLDLEGQGFLLSPAVDQPIVCVPAPWEVGVCPRYPEIECVVHEQIRQERTDDALNAKDNFCFDRLIKGWRSRSVLDLRHKR